MNIEDKVLEHFGYDVVLLSDAQEAIEEAEIRQKKRYRKEIEELKIFQEVKLAIIREQERQIRELKKRLK